MLELGAAARGIGRLNAALACLAAVAACGSVAGQQARRAPCEAERWNGSSWRVIRSVNMARWNQLSAVSCTSPRACTAVGSASGQFALAERWDGSAWKTQHVPA